MRTVVQDVRGTGCVTIQFFPTPESLISIKQNERCETIDVVVNIKVGILLTLGNRF